MSIITRFAPAAAVAALAGGIAFAAPAQAASTPSVAVTLSRTAIAVNGTAKVTVAARSGGASYWGFGVQTPLWPTAGSLTVTNATCSARTGLLYCVANYGASSASISYTVQPTVAGSYTFTGYARNLNTMQERSASATLTVK